MHTSLTFSTNNVWRASEIYFFKLYAAFYVHFSDNSDSNRQLGWLSSIEKYKITFNQSCSRCFLPFLHNRRMWNPRACISILAHLMLFLKHSTPPETVCINTDSLGINMCGYKHVKPKDSKLRSNN